MSVNHIGTNKYQIIVSDETIIALTSDDGKVIKMIGGGHHTNTPELGDIVQRIINNVL